jgi:hypothetical protein
MFKNLLLFVFFVASFVANAQTALVLTTTPAGPFRAGQTYSVTLAALKLTSFGPPPTFVGVSIAPGALGIVATGCTAIQVTSGFSIQVDFTIPATAVTGDAFNMLFTYTNSPDPTASTQFGSNVLPITLSRFDAQAADGSVNLSWLTETETNNAKFLVERSFNGKDFATIGEKAGAGTTSAPQSYSFEDKTAMTTAFTMAYYRLKNIATDGSEAVSSQVVVDLRKTNKTIITSVAPATSTLTFNADTNSEGEITILDASGRVVAKQNLTVTTGYNQIDMDFSGLQSGLYIAVLRTENAIATQKFVK